MKTKIKYTAALLITAVTFSATISSQEPETVINEKQIQKFYDNYDNIEVVDFKKLYRERDLAGIKSYIMETTTNDMPKLESYAELLAEKNQEKEQDIENELID